MLKRLVSGIKRIGLLGNCAIVITAGLIQDAGGLITDFSFKYWFPDAAYNRCLNTYFHDNPRPSSGVYHVLVTVPEGDVDLGQFRLIDRTLRRLYGDDLNAVIQVEALPCAPVRQTAGLASAAATEARRRAEAILVRAQADVAIWGESLNDDTLHLRFTRRNDQSSDDYTIDETEDVVLETKFGANLGALIAAKAIVRSNVTFEQSGSYLVPRMERAVAITSPLLANMPNGISPENRAAILMSHAIAQLYLGIQRGLNLDLFGAITAYRAALEVHTRNALPHQWAATQNNLGFALQTLGAREEGNARLEQAVTAFQNALEVLTRAELPLDWAATQNNLGLALWTLGAREEGTARLEQAVTAFQNALEVYTRADMPLQWATTRNNLGIVLRNLGAREEGTAQLEQAVTAFQNALEVRTRADMPLQWAGTQNNLGTALSNLGEREEGTARLEQAVTAFQNALKVRTHADMPLQSAMTQNNLGVALKTLGAWEEGTARLEQAVTAYQNALEVLTRADMPLQWAMTQNNLGNVLQTLGAREVYTVAGADFYINKATRLRDKIQATLNALTKP